MKKLLLRSITACVGVWACVVAAGLAWLPFGNRLGRDLRPAATTAGLLVLAFGILVRRHLGWRFRDFLGAAVAAEVALLLLVSHFSGASGARLLDPFNLRWWAFLNLFVGLPWLGGYVLGSRARPRA